MPGPDDVTIRVGILDLDGNPAYIGGTNYGYRLTEFGSWQIDQQRVPLVAAPTLFDNTDNGEIDALAFLGATPATSGLHLLRQKRLDSVAGAFPVSDDALRREITFEQPEAAATG